MSSKTRLQKDTSNQSTNKNLNVINEFKLVVRREMLINQSFKNIKMFKHHNDDNIENAGSTILNKNRKNISRGIIDVYDIT